MAGPVPTEHVDYAAGNAHVEITGDFEQTLDLPLEGGGSSYFEPDRDVVNLNWKNADAQGVFLTVFMAEGTPKVDTCDIQLTAGDPDDILDNYDPTDEDACDVALTALTATTIQGTFSCTELEGVNGGKTVQANGSFTATA